MKWTINAVARDTGRPVPEMVVEADSEEEAVKQVKGKNILITSINKAQELPPIHLTEKDNSARMQRRPMQPKPPVILATPNYLWLRILGAIYVTIGGVMVAGVVISFILLTFTREDDSALISGASLLVFGGAFFIGALFLALGELLYGFRDIARNSWELPRIAEMFKRRT